MKAFKILSIIFIVAILSFSAYQFFSEKGPAHFSKNNITISLEIAKTEKEREYGLMNRRSMPQHHGMLFIFEEPEILSFWMKNTLIPLDMIFLNDNKVVAIFSYVPPCKKETNPCPSYGPDVPADQVIELNAGMAEKLQIADGNELILKLNH